MSSSRTGRAMLLTALLITCPVFGQEKDESKSKENTSSSAPQEAQTAPADPPPPSVWSVGPITFSGYVDGYYSYNANHPASQTNQLLNFDVKANQFSLNMAKLTLEHAADPVGFRVDFGFGRTFDMIHASNTPETLRHLEQAYVSIKPQQLKGLQLDFGEFVTSVGAEVIESKDNWTYSRSLLFSWANPYIHFGLRATMPITKSFNAGFQVVNGWNNFEDNNSGKTIGVTTSFTKSKFTWNNAYYVGPEKADTNKGTRHLYDTVLLLTPNEKLNAYIQFDYGREARIGSGIDRWIGVAAAARYSISNRFAVAVRGEHFYDATGFNTGTKQTLNEITIAGDYKMVEGFLARLEYRRDHSDVPFFDRGGTPLSSKNQNTITLGMMAYFGPKR